MPTALHVRAICSFSEAIEAMQMLLTRNFDGPRSPYLFAFHLQLVKPRKTHHTANKLMKYVYSKPFQPSPTAAARLARKVHGFVYFSEQASQICQIYIPKYGLNGLADSGSL